MKFEINNTIWIIEDVDEATINNEMKNDGTLGVTIYKSQKILLLKDQANIVKTLKHELTHVWLYEYGHNQSEKEFNCEDVCEIVASSNDFINSIVDKYLGINTLYLCDAKKNNTCKKNSCYLNEGECMQTSNKRFARKKNYEYTKQDK